MDKNTELDLAHNNLRDTIKYRVKNIKEGKLYETDDFLLFTIGIDTTDGHLNGCLSFNDDLYEEIFNEAENFFNKLGFSYSFWVRDGVDIKLGNLLEDKGYEPKRLPGSSIMTIDKKIKDASLPAGFTLKTVESNKDIEDVKKVIEDSFEKESDVVNQMFSSSKNLISENVVSFLIHDENKNPVSTAITSITKDASGIYYVGTVEDARSKGLGKAIVKESTNIGFDLGKELVILQASELGEIVYNKLGFKKIGVYKSYSINK